MTDATNGEALFHHLPDNERSALLWLLWHHQGASSEIGQTIRGWLGMRQFERINDAAVEQCKRVEALLTQPTASAGMVVVPREPTEAMLDAGRTAVMARDCSGPKWGPADHFEATGFDTTGIPSRLLEGRYKMSKEWGAELVYAAMLAAHESQQKPRVNVGTIGHVSRDKSTLVAALTKVVSPPADTAPDVSERIPSKERGCDGKTDFGSHYESAARSLSKRHCKRYGVYRCPHCQGTHLTTKLEKADQYAPLLYVTPEPTSNVEGE